MMLNIRSAAVVFFAVAVPSASGQIISSLQERSVQTFASVTSGASDNGYAEATNFGPFTPSIASSVSGAGGATADSQASQNTSFSSTAVAGQLHARSDVRTGSTFVVGEADGQSSYLYFFSLASATPVQFLASGTLALFGSNPDGEPSDLYGFARARLLDSNSMDLIAGFNIGPAGGTDSASFNGTLPAGDYVILAQAQTHGYSADLLGPPARAGWADSTVNLTLTVVPSPAGLCVLTLGLLATGRRRR